MTTPTRIQRRREAGWRAPLDAQGRRPVYVGRPTRWGNPWAVTETSTGWAITRDWRGGWDVGLIETVTREAAHQVAVGLYREWVEANADLARLAREGLAGRALMCWCAPEFACHVDHLLTVANPLPAAVRAGGDA